MKTLALINLSFWITALIVGIMTRMSYKAGWFVTTMAVFSAIGCGIIEAIDNRKRDKERDREQVRKQNFCFYPPDISIERPKEPLKGFDSWETRRYTPRWSENFITGRG